SAQCRDLSRAHGCDGTATQSHRRVEVQCCFEICASCRRGREDGAPKARGADRGMKNRNRTALGLKVDEVISAFGPEHPEIAMLLLEVLEDERAAVKFGLVEKLRRGAPTGRNNRRRIEIARAYLIERHKLGNRRGSAKQATEKICAKYGIDE